jgi:hypothetical protein
MTELSKLYEELDRTAGVQVCAAEPGNLLVAFEGGAVPPRVMALLSRAEVRVRHDPNGLVVETDSVMIPVDPEVVELVHELNDRWDGMSTTERMEWAQDAMDNGAIEADDLSGAVESMETTFGILAKAAPRPEGGSA